MELIAVYSPESPLKQPFKIVREIFRDIVASRELIWILFTRDLKAQYRQSYFGYIWLFVPVISTTLVWMFLNSTRVIQVAETPIPYPAYVLLGSMIWGLFTASVNQPLGSFTAAKSVLMKLKVAPEVFVLAGLSRIVFELAIRLVVVIPILWLTDIPIAPTFWLFPIGLLSVCTCGLAIGMLILPIGSLYGDVIRFVGTGLSFGMYITPVVYPPPSTGWAANIVNANPMTAMVVTTRDWLTLGHSPLAVQAMITAMISVAVLMLGLIMLRISLPHIVERMGM